MQKSAQAKAHPSGASAGKGGGSGGSAGKGGGTKTGGSDGASSRSNGGASGGDGGGGGGGSSGPSCETHSFAPGTLVLMADGSHRPIDQVKVGDKVIATDPKTGKTTARPVTALHTNQDTDLTDVTVKITRVTPAATGGTGGTGAGQVRAAVTRAALVLSPAVAVAALVLAPAAPANASQGHPQDAAATQSRVEVVETTAHHPFWNTTTGTWTNATDLNPGDQLHDLPTGTGVGTAGDTTVTVTRVHNYTRTRTMHDLTVDVDHTYHIVTDATPVLVHNCGELDWSRAKINEGGVNAVERHLSRFMDGGALESAEQGMLNRLRRISAGDLEATSHDLRFYTHELRESVLYRKAGYPTGQPEIDSYEIWDQLHTQALKDYGLTRIGAPNDLYHPSVR